MEAPMPNFDYFVKQLAEKHSDLAYVHLVEPRFNGFGNKEAQEYEGEVSLYQLGMCSNANIMRSPTISFEKSGTLVRSSAQAVTSEILP